MRHQLKTKCPSMLVKAQHINGILFSIFCVLVILKIHFPQYVSYTLGSVEQVGKGRDVGLNQIALFEAKVASGNGEQSLSRDVYRLGQLLDFPRMLSFFYTSVGFYVTTMV